MKYGAARSPAYLRMQTKAQSQPNSDATKYHHYIIIQYVYYTSMQRAYTLHTRILVISVECDQHSHIS